MAKERNLSGKHKKPRCFCWALRPLSAFCITVTEEVIYYGQNFWKTKLPQSSSLVIGIIGLLLVGYAFFSGSLSSDSISGSAEPLMKRAKEDLANCKGIDKEKIAVAVVKAVNWPDTGLGCPEPGMVYARVITRDYRILLSYDGKIYEYHSDQGGRVIYCQQ